jgi:N-acylneuraminate cytidylyltransferase/CMP-N,N'-diacetyllegionaminic acid synthase
MGKKIAIIPARGGSKGIPNKNLIDVCGKPLIYYTIKRAFESNEFDAVVVSSDSDLILKVSLEINKNIIPHKRPLKLASDSSKSIDVIIDVLDNYPDFDFVSMLEPTSPLRSENFIKSAHDNLINNPNAESLVGVSKVEDQHPSFLCKKDEFDLISPLSGSNKNIRRQDLNENYFFYEGSIYSSYVSSLRKTMNFYHEKTIGYEVNKLGAFEVDDNEDLTIVRQLISIFFKI